MKCTNCLFENSNNENFCNECGWPLAGKQGYEKPAYSPNAPLNSLNVPLSSLKSKNSEVKCPYCSEIHFANLFYCPKTGNKLQGDSMPLVEIKDNDRNEAKFIVTDKNEIKIAKFNHSFGREDFNRFLSKPQLLFITREHHFNLSYQDNTYFIEDSGSRNGTKVNGSEIRREGRIPLNDGDVIEIADVLTITFTLY